MFNPLQILFFFVFFRMFLTFFRFLVCSIPVMLNLIGGLQPPSSVRYFQWRYAKHFSFHQFLIYHSSFLTIIFCPLTFDCCCLTLWFCLPSSHLQSLLLDDFRFSLDFKLPLNTSRFRLKSSHNFLSWPWFHRGQTNWLPAPFSNLLVSD